MKASLLEGLNAAFEPGQDRVQQPMCHKYMPEQKAVLQGLVSHAGGISSSAQLCLVSRLGTINPRETRQATQQAELRLCHA